MITALYLAHLNPVTNAHVEIITELKKQADIVKVMPVVFKDEDREINSKKFSHLILRLEKKCLKLFLVIQSKLPMIMHFMHRSKNICHH